MPAKNKGTGLGESIGAAVVPIALELGAEIVKLVINAFTGGDLATLKKVTDLLPKDHKLRSEVVYAAEMEKLRKKLEDEKK